MDEAQQRARESFWTAFPATVGLVRRVLRYFLCPSLMGPRHAYESVGRTTLRFAAAIVLLWAVLVFLCSLNSLPTHWGAFLYFEKWAEGFRAAFDPDIVSNLILLFVATVLGCSAISVLASWLWLVDSYRFGSVWHALRRAHRVSVAGFWLLCVLGLFCNFIFLVIASYDWPGKGLEEVVFGTASAGLLSLAALITWLGKANRSIPGSTPEFSPVCEECGYDLSHNPASGLCPECGMDTQSSLIEGGARCDSEWERRASILPWLKTAAAIVIRPAAYYKHLRMRGGDSSARRFAYINYTMMGLGAAVWMFAILVHVFDTSPDVHFLRPILLFAVYGAIVILMGWSLNRLIAAVVTTLWFAANWIRDGRWCRKVLFYETAFLWVFCAFNGLFFSSLALFDSWILKLEEHVLGYRMSLLGIPPEPILLWIGNLALIILWFMRYRTILRSIRWNNF